MKRVFAKVRWPAIVTGIFTYIVALVFIYGTRYGLHWSERDSDLSGVFCIPFTWIFNVLIYPKERRE